MIAAWAQLMQEREGPEFHLHKVAKGLRNGAAGGQEKPAGFAQTRSGRIRAILGAWLP